MDDFIRKNHQLVGAKIGVTQFFELFGIEITEHSWYNRAIKLGVANPSISRIKRPHNVKYSELHRFI